MTREKAVDLVMNAQRGSAEGLGAGGAPGAVLEFRGQRQPVVMAEAGGNVRVGGCPAWGDPAEVVPRRVRPSFFPYHREARGRRRRAEVPPSRVRRMPPPLASKPLRDRARHRLARQDHRPTPRQTERRGRGQRRAQRPRHHRQPGHQREARAGRAPASVRCLHRMSGELRVLGNPNRKSGTKSSEFRG